MTEDMDAQTAAHVKANDLADGYAKDARWFYPSNACDRLLGRDLAKVHRLTEEAARLIGRISQIFRPQDPQEKLDRKTKTEGAKEKWLTLGHDWAFR